MLRGPTKLVRVELGRRPVVKDVGISPTDHL